MERRQDVREAMVGLSRTDVLACAGAPFREAGEGSIAVMTYSDFRAVDGDLFRCEVSVTLRDGLVDNVRYRGARGVCAAILRACRT